MADQLKWAIENMTRRVADDVVITAHWSYTAKNGAFSASEAGVVSFQEPEPETFIPYAELTNDVVLDWVAKTLGVENVENVEKSAAENLRLCEKPAEVDGMPWVLPEPEPEPELEPTEDAYVDPAESQAAATGGVSRVEG